MFNNIIRVFILVAIFTFGFIFGFFWERLFVGESLTGSAISVPSDFVDDREILVYDDEVVIKIDGATLSNYDSTGSMLPFFGENANGITIKPESEEQIKEGDIVTFSKNGELIVHRVVSRGVDSEGVYFITKGDNSEFDDGKIRFNDIEKVL